MTVNEQVQTGPSHGILMYDIEACRGECYYAFRKQLSSLGALQLNQSVYLIRWAMSEEVKTLWERIEKDMGKFGSLHLVEFQARSQAEIKGLAQKALSQFVDEISQSLKTTISNLEKRFGEKKIGQDDLRSKRRRAVNRARRRFKEAKTLAVIWGMEREIKKGMQAIQKTIDVQLSLEAA